MSTHTFVDPENVRGADMMEVYKKITDAGIDPFEREHFAANHSHPILFENQNWFLTLSQFPYENTSLHLLLIHRAFITDACQMTPQGWTDLGEVMCFAQEKFGFESSALMMRSGDTSQTGASVTHLHAHIIVAAKDGMRHSIYPVVTSGTVPI